MNALPKLTAEVARVLGRLDDVIAGLGLLAFVCGTAGLCVTHCIKCSLIVSKSQETEEDDHDNL